MRAPVGTRYFAAITALTSLSLAGPRETRTRSGRSTRTAPGTGSKLYSSPRSPSDTTRRASSIRTSRIWFQRLTRPSAATSTDQTWLAMRTPPSGRRSLCRLSPILAAPRSSGRETIDAQAVAGQIVDEAEPDAGNHLAPHPNLLDLRRPRAGRESLASPALRRIPKGSWRSRKSSVSCAPVSPTRTSRRWVPAKSPVRPGRSISRTCGGSTQSYSSHTWLDELGPGGNPPARGVAKMNGLHLPPRHREVCLDERIHLGRTGTIGIPDDQTLAGTSARIPPAEPPPLGPSPMPRAPGGRPPGRPRAGSDSPSARGRGRWSSRRWNRGGDSPGRFARRGRSPPRRALHPVRRARWPAAPGSG